MRGSRRDSRGRGEETVAGRGGRRRLLRSQIEQGAVFSLRKSTIQPLSKLCFLNFTSRDLLEDHGARQQFAACIVLLCTLRLLAFPLGFRLYVLALERLELLFQGRDAIFHFPHDQYSSFGEDFRLCAPEPATRSSCRSVSFSAPRPRAL